MNHSNNNNHHNNTKPYSKLPSYNNAAAAVSNVFKQKEALPVEGKKQEIIEGLRNHDELIIVAETGAGKSTEVPQYLCEAGYNVIITQPRVLAAMSLAKYVAGQMNSALGETVGYHVGGGREDSRRFSDKTKIKYCTDGLQLVKQLMDKEMTQSNGKETVLIIDEVHERNQNIEVLIAWVKLMKKKGKKIKLVLMSATIDAEQLQDFLEKDKSEGSTGAKRINISGRLFPVQRSQEPASALIPKAKELAAARRNVLIFQPGKKQIEETIKKLEEEKVDAVILPLHGELTPDEQQRIYKKYDKPVIIVSTNIAQTSVTIPYIDAVLDSGKENRIELRDGIEALVSGDISQADSKQREGRAGRCKEGIYMLCSDTPYHQFPLYPKPEIQRTRIDLNYLKILSTTGLKMEELDFFHPIPMESIQKTKESMQLLGIIHKDGTISPRGSKLASFSIDVNSGVMLLEAEKLGCVDEILTIAAIREVGGIKENKKDVRINGILKNVGEIPLECINPLSDLITEMNLYHQACHKKNDVYEIGVRTKAFTEAKRIRSEYYSAIQGKISMGNKISGDKTQAILRCIVAGMIDNIWKYESSYKHKTYYTNNKDNTLQIDKKSVVRSNIIVAEKKSIPTQDNDIIEFITNASVASSELIAQVAPHLITTTKGYVSWDYSKQQFSQEIGQEFNGLMLGMYTAEAEASETSIKDFCEKMALGSSYIEVSNELQDVIRHNEETQQKLGQLKERTGGQIHGQDLPHWDNEQLAEFYREVLFSHKIHSTQELNEFIERYGNSILKLNDISLLIPEYDKIIKQYPDTIQHPNGHIYEVRYGSNHPMVVIPLNDIEIIRDTDFNHYFEGKIYDFYVNAYAVRSIENYAKENQERLKEMKWEDFQITHPVSEDISFDAWDETYIPNEVVYDQATQAVAYECLTTEYMGKEYRKIWVRDKKDATLITNQTRSDYKKYMQQKKTAEQAQNDWNETYYELSRLYGEAEYKKKENPVLLKAASDDDFYHIQELWDRVEKERPTQTRYRTIEQMEDSIADLNEIITLLVEVLKSRNSSKKKEKLEVMNQETAEDLTQSLSNLRGKFGGKKHEKNR